ncbi:hypothetical protein HMPREF1556_00644 [Porphyromonas sp. oral taxon 278 str. W7784]|nr:hypothetical protein HMPREF1556_00644 [Porphyromonas sp. oral taxon 278 str. W7784]
MHGGQGLERSKYSYSAGKKLKPRARRHAPSPTPLSPPAPRGKKKPTVGRRKNLLWVASPTYRRSLRRPTVGFFFALPKAFPEARPFYEYVPPFCPHRYDYLCPRSTVMIPRPKAEENLSLGLLVGIYSGRKPPPRSIRSSSPSLTLQSI